MSAVGFTNDLDGARQNEGTLQSEERREKRLFLGLSAPAVLLILIVVFLPIFWLSSLSFFSNQNALK